MSTKDKVILGIGAAFAVYFLYFFGELYMLNRLLHQQFPEHMKIDIFQAV